MKIYVVNKSTLKVETSYDADAPRQGDYGGRWGDPAQSTHMDLGSKDVRATTFTLVNGKVVATEDADLKAQFAQQDAIAAISVVVRKAQAFGQGLMTKFAAENVMLGITQDGKTGEVLDKMTGVVNAMQSGSLYEAIARAKAIPQSEYDSKYVTNARLYSFINEIERYLGIDASM